MRYPSRVRLVVPLVIITAVLSAAASAIAATPLSVDSPPAINGTAEQGFALTASHGSYSYGGTPVTPQSFTYQWQRCDAMGNACVSIAGATGQSYTLTSADVGHTIRVTETASYTPPGQTTAVTASSRSAATRVVTPPGGPKVVATTLPADGITRTAATLHGTISPAGAAVTWQFQFGQSTNYNKGTPIQTITSGRTTPQSVKWGLINLKPNTTYHFRLVATSTFGGRTTTTYGKDLTFTTKPNGRFLLLSKNLAVHNGQVGVPVKCASSANCNAQFTITTKTTVSGGAPGTVVCTVKVAHLNGGQQKTVQANVRKACRTLLQNAKNHQIKGQFTSRPRSGQRGVIKNVTLFLA